MADPDDRLERLEAAVHELSTWRASHSARFDERWKTQEAANKETRVAFDWIGKRLTALERRVIWLSAAAAGVGGAAGNFIF